LNTRWRSAPIGKAAPGSGSAGPARVEYGVAGPRRRGPRLLAPGIALGWGKPHSRIRLVPLHTQGRSPRSRHTHSPFLSINPPKAALSCGSDSVSSDTGLPQPAMILIGCKARLQRVRPADLLQPRGDLGVIQVGMVAALAADELELAGVAAFLRPSNTRAGWRRRLAVLPCPGWPAKGGVITTSGSRRSQTSRASRVARAALERPGHWCAVMCRLQHALGRRCCPARFGRLAWLLAAASV
jgi:hypothetical protein